MKVLFGAAVVAALQATSLHAQQIVATEHTTNTGAASFGGPNSATFGQTFIAPSGLSSFDAFDLFLAPWIGDPSTVLFRAFVMAWDDVSSRSTGPVLFQSALMDQSSGAVVPSNWLGNLHRFSVSTGGIAVTPGQSYVAFLNASEYIGATTFEPNEYHGYLMRYGQAQTAGVGRFVYLNNGSDFSRVTQDEWGDVGGVSAQFSGYFSSDPTVTPEPVSLALLGTGLVGVGAARRRRRRQES